MATATKEKKAPAEAPAPKAGELLAVCQRAELLAAVDFVGSAVPARPSKPALGGIQLVATKKQIRLRATNLGEWLSQVTSQVQIERTGQVVLPAAKLKEVLRAMPDETVRLEVAGDKARIIGERSDFTLYAIIEEFPADPAVPEPVTLTMPLLRLKQMLARVLPAISKEQNRYAFAGPLLRVQDGKLLVVATDGRRLHLDCDSATKKVQAEAIIPAETARHILLMEAAEEDQVEINFSPSHVSFECNDTRIGTGLLEGTFPDWQDVAPKESTRKMVLSRDALIDALKQAMTLSREDENTRGHKARFVLSKKRMVISASQVACGTASVHVDGVLEGEPLEIGLNPAFVVDAIEEAGQEITLELTDANRPVKISDGSQYIAVIMPTNLL